MLNALRLNKPIKLSHFSEKTHLDGAFIRPILEEAKEKALLKFNEEKIMLTPLGRRYLNEITAMFL